MSGSFQFISAGAGSGKTYRLMEVLYGLLVDADDPVHPEGVLAMTFTNKAAGELRERVRSKLIDEQRFDLATAMGQARIGTVNSVCGALLERFAFEAGIPTQQHVLDELRAGQVLTEAIDTAIERESLTDFLVVARRLGQDSGSYGADSVPWQRALNDLVSQARANTIGPARLRSFAQRNADALLQYFPAPVSDDLDAALLAAIDGVLPGIHAEAEAGGKKNTRDYLRRLEQVKQALERGDCAWSDWAGLTKEEPQAALRGSVQPVKDAASRHERHPRLHEDVRQYLQQLFAMAADVLEAYQARKRQLAAIDFTDQESELLAILDHPAVAEMLRDELDLLMVDEFQDTSPIQLALFLKFAKYARRVVWVGDIKQAIYGFRGGDAALMAAVIHQLDRLGGAKQVLERSWRSRPALVGLTNHLFGNAFDGLDPSDVHLQPVREEFTGTHALEDWHLPGRSKDEQHAAMAGGIVALLAEGTQVFDPASRSLRPLRLGDIAILARSNANVMSIAQALHVRGIRVSTEQPGLLGKPEVVLALACLRRLNDERDTIASAQIVSLAECEAPEGWLADRLAWLDRGEASSTWREQGDTAHPLLATLHTLRAQRSIFSPREAVQLVIAQCDLARHALKWQASPERARLRLANLQRLVELAAEYEDECLATRDAATISGFLLWTQALATSRQDALPQPAIDAVQIMTHHAAKGLEWPVVILADLTSPIRDSIWNSVRAESEAALDIGAPLQGRFLRYWPGVYGIRKQVPVVDAAETGKEGLAIRAAAVEEHKRLLYVSFTRARDLVILARPGKSLTGEWMETIDLAAVLPAGDSLTLELPGGVSVPFQRRHLKAHGVAQEAAEAVEPLRWLTPASRLTVKVPWAVTLSSVASVPAKILQNVPVGTRIPTHRDVDPALLGEAVHACLASQLACPTVPMEESAVADLLQNMGVDGVVSPASLLGQVRAVQQWLATRWPAAEPMVEVPVTRVLSSGQVLTGRVDLLLRSSEGWILLDYKSGAQGSRQWQDLATRYGGQLRAYADAIEAVTEQPVRQVWLVLPIAGFALELAV